MALSDEGATAAAYRLSCAARDRFQSFLQTRLRGSGAAYAGLYGRTSVLVPPFDTPGLERTLTKSEVENNGYGQDADDGGG